MPQWNQLISTSVHFGVYRLDAIIEVVSNSLRPHGIKVFVDAAAAAEVDTFVACGGAFALFVDEQKNRVISTIDNADYSAMNDMHMAVQELAFASPIKNVLQICPPYMTDNPLTGNYAPQKDFADGVMQVGYADVASCIVTAMSDPSAYNRGMMAIANKK